MLKQRIEMAEDIEKGEIAHGKTAMVNIYDRFESADVVKKTRVWQDESFY